MTRGDFARALLAGLGAPVTKHNLWAVVAWETAEGTKAKFNPLATTLPEEGATDFNSTGVKNYPSASVGIAATVATLTEKGHGYEAIVTALRSGDWARDTLLAVADSDWGTGALALSILRDVKQHWAYYRDRLIGG
jgi:hypothetical protein